MSKKRVGTVFHTPCNYSKEEIELLKKHYVATDPTTWPYYPIPMPSKDGRGPVSEAECDHLEFEVWDKFYCSVASFEHLPAAIKHAMELNEKVLGHV